MNDSFNTFRSLLAEIEQTFLKLSNMFPHEIRCKKGCVDCCHACFDVSFVEAAFISRRIKEVFDPAVLERITQRALIAKKEVDEKLKNLPADITKQDIIEQFAHWRVRCPLLSDDDVCELYDSRPITCRVYGLPTEIGGSGHVCGYSGFDKGKTYPTIKMDAIAGYLEEMSVALAKELPEIPDDWGRKRFFIHEAIAIKTI